MEWGARRGMNKLTSCFHRTNYFKDKDWALDLDQRTIPGDSVANLMAAEIVSERKRQLGKTTANELGALFRSLELLALSNAFHTLQGKNSDIDSPCIDLLDKDNPGIDGYFHEMEQDNFVSEQIVTDLSFCFYDCFSPDANPPEEFEDEFLDALEDILNYSYRVMFIYLLDKASKGT